jgi:hypothetical protein
MRSAVTLLLALSGGAALAQGPPPGTSEGGSTTSSGASRFSEMKVSIDVERGRLVTVVPTLLKSIGAEYVIDAEVKNAVVSSHLTNVKLQTALDTLLRVSDIPVKYTFEKGAYHFSLKVEPPPKPAPPAMPIPGESVLPPPPDIVEDVVDVHNVQTFDLVRVLHDLLGLPAGIDPTFGEGGSSGVANTPIVGSISGSSSVGGNSLFGLPGRNARSQNSAGGVLGSITGHSFWIGAPGR